MLHADQHVANGAPQGADAGSAEPGHGLPAGLRRDGHLVVHDRLMDGQRAGWGASASRPPHGVGRLGPTPPLPTKRAWCLPLPLLDLRACGAFTVGQDRGVADAEDFVPFPETPTLLEARIAAHPAGGRDCLLATTADGQRLAFGFEAESDRPGLEIVDPQLWLEAGREPEDSPRVFEAVKEINADDWLQAVFTNPVGNEWLDAH